MANVNRSREIREFLASRRARVTPEKAGLPVYGANRRVKGLRREEVAMLAGVSIDYYTSSVATSPVRRKPSSSRWPAR